MLREVAITQPERGEHRRWFADEEFDVIVSLSEAAGSIVAVQLCYDKGGVERAMTWSAGGGYGHARVDTGEIAPTRNHTPILVATDDPFPRGRVMADFVRAAAGMDPEVRDFVLTLLTGFTGARSPGMTTSDIDIDRLCKDIEALAGFTSGGGPGVTRLSFSDEYRAARDYLHAQMEAAGMSVAEIPPGVLIGRLASPGSDGPAVMAGSHIDTVLQAGRFDGIVGVVGALEVARVMAERRAPLRRPFEVVVLPEEEGTSFGSVLTGSKAWVGQLTSDDLARMRRPDGTSYLDAMERYGLAADGLETHRLRRGRAKAFLELHIEQSVVLEQARVQIGVVTTITGIRGFDIVLGGVANHAGATPMSGRRDALAGAAEIMGEIERTTPTLGRHTVCTVGQVEVSPGARNVIPGEVRLSVDVRDIEGLDPKWQALAPRIEAIAKRRGLGYSVRPVTSSEPVALAPGLLDLIEASARGRGFSCRRMPSGAVHDAQVMATVTDAGMIFVPSRAGRSHCPEEFTAPDDLARGTQVLLDVVLALTG